MSLENEVKVVSLRVLLLEKSFEVFDCEVVFSSMVKIELNELEWEIYVNWIFYESFLEGLKKLIVVVEFGLFEVIGWKILMVIVFDLLSEL